MKNIFNSKVEQKFYELSGKRSITTEMPYITVDNFPKLGLLTALRFIEWVGENPDGIISLPTGKTPEYFIKYTHFLLKNWNTKSGIEIREKYGLKGFEKPNFNNITFVQIDEFFPIDPKQHNSFCNYVLKYYINGFGLNHNKSLLINSNDIALANNLPFSEVFPNYYIDLSLRYREANSILEELQRESIFKIDNWCINYEQKIRDIGGIGFFLGGIGPDGHIAFNVKGSDHFSTTRLTPTNFETQAVAAGDLGGIEVSKNRLVITIGLGTITYNKNATAIIFAAGEAKAEIVKKSLESKPDAIYPATVLQKLNNSRFYLTSGAAIKLTDSVNDYYNNGEWTFQKTEKAITDLCCNIKKYAHHLTIEDLKNDRYCKLIPNLSLKAVIDVENSIKNKLFKGIEKIENQVIYHTGPHHDDIMLGIMPYTIRQVRSHTNQMHFAILTSGFTAVTNKFIIEVLNDTIHLLENKQIQMIYYPDFFEKGYKFKRDKDVYHYLSGVAAQNKAEQRRGLCHRVVRDLKSIFNDINDEKSLLNTIYIIIEEINNSYDGSKNSYEVQQLKGMLREFEEELVWSHFGVQVSNVHHLRLGFYKGDLFTETPEKQRDIIPVLNEFRKYKPTMISVAMDPEGSGPDTHYKVLQTIAGAVKEWKNEQDLSNLKIIGYRNVWFRYHLAETDVIIPVSLNSFDVLQNSFSDCYMSQVNASFPSYEYDGKFSQLAQKIWVEQLNQVQLIIGKDYFYTNKLPLVRATHGTVFIKQMNVDEFVELAEELEKLTEGITDINMAIQ